MKITIDKQVIEQALEALEMNWAVIDTATKQEAITALRSALAESVEQEPVAWCFRKALVQKLQWHKPTGGESVLRHWEPLYTAPAVPEVEKYREALEMARDAMNNQLPGSQRITGADKALAKIEEVLNK